LYLNLQKRRDLIKSKSVINIKSVMPDCVMPYVIHLLAHMPFYTNYDDIHQLDVVKGDSFLSYCFVSNFNTLKSLSLNRMSLVYHGTFGSQERALFILIFQENLREHQDMC